jgi:hypothetical protein
MTTAHYCLQVRRLPNRTAWLPPWTEARYGVVTFVALQKFGFRFGDVVNLDDSAVSFCYAATEARHGGWHVEIGNAEEVA